jgi:hypothetical protein
MLLQPGEERGQIGEGVRHVLGPDRILKTNDERAQARVALSGDDVEQIAPDGRNVKRCAELECVHLVAFPQHQSWPSVRITATAR